MINNSIEARILRVKVLALDTADEMQRNYRRFTAQDHEDLTAVLDELHRLHLTVSKQREEIDKLEAKRK